MGVAMVDAGPHDLEEVLSAAEAQGPRPLLLLFLADRDPQLGSSWCPDCVRAEPVIYELLNGTEKEVTLVRAYVGDRPTWRTPAHPWRLDKRFQLKGVPTLIRWENGTAVARLEDHEAHLKPRIEKLLI